MAPTRRCPTIIRMAGNEDVKEDVHRRKFNDGSATTRRATGEVICPAIFICRISGQVSWL